MQSQSILSAIVPVTTVRPGEDSRLHSILITVNTGLHGKMDGMKDRSDIWVAMSDDGGRNWTVPRLLFANATKPNPQKNGWFNHNDSYLDAAIPTAVDIAVTEYGRIENAVDPTFRTALPNKRCRVSVRTHLNHGGLAVERHDE